MEEKIRRERKAKLYECETMYELNTQLISYIKDYYNNILLKYSNEAIRFKLIKKNNSYIFSCKYAYNIQDVLGIKTDIVYYKNICEKLTGFLLFFLERKMMKVEKKEKLKEKPLNFLGFIYVLLIMLPISLALLGIAIPSAYYR